MEIIEQEPKGNLFLSASYNITPKKMFHMLFDDVISNAKFNEKMGITGYENYEWQETEEGKRSRTCFFTKKLDIIIAPKTTLVTEKQLVTKFEEETIVVKTEAQSEGVPYSDSFTVVCHYSFSAVDEESTLLKVHGELNFTKSVWLIKSFVEKSAYEGMNEHFKALDAFLKEKIGDSKLEEREEGVVEEVAQEADALLIPSQINVAIPDYSLYFQLIILIFFSILMVLIWKLPNQQDHEAMNQLLERNIKLMYAQNLQNEMEMLKHVSSLNERVEELLEEIKSMNQILSHGK